jgi:hypothetical protein
MGAERSGRMRFTATANHGRFLAYIAASRRIARILPGVNTPFAGHVQIRQTTQRMGFFPLHAGLFYRLGRFLQQQGENEPLPIVLGNGLYGRKMRCQFAKQHIRCVIAVNKSFVRTRHIGFDCNNRAFLSQLLLPQKPPFTQYQQISHICHANSGSLYPAPVPVPLSSPALLPKPVRSMH